MSEGAEDIGTQLLESDKNEKNRTEQEGCMGSVPVDLTSLLAALGNQEAREVRSDRPTNDLEGTQHVFAFESTRKTTVSCGDLGKCLIHQKGA